MNQVIFFVEDDENINTLIQETLENSNFEAHGFLEPLSFLKKLSVKKPDLIVLDLMLPKMNGYEILKFLKDNYPEINECLTDKTGIVNIVKQDKDSFELSSGGGKIRSVIDRRIQN